MGNHETVEELDLRRPQFNRGPLNPERQDPGTAGSPSQLTRLAPGEVPPAVLPPQQLDPMTPDAGASVLAGQFAGGTTPPGRERPAPPVKDGGIRPAYREAPPAREDH